jgi:hypothetical protein
LRDEESTSSGEAKHWAQNSGSLVSIITADAVEALTRAQVPRGTLDWIQDFEAGLEAGLTADQRFDFRIYLIPHTGPKSTADAALTFVRADQFTPEQNAIMEQVQTIIREKKVPVEDLNGMLPRAVVEQVSKRLDKPFTMHTHTQAWRYYKVRPQSSAADPFATKSDFCRYNKAFQPVHLHDSLGRLPRPPPVLTGLQRSRELILPLGLWWAWI